MKIMIDKEGNAWSEFGPRIFDWGMLLLCIINIVTVVMVVFQIHSVRVQAQENRERIDVIYEVMTVTR
jgi:hypothetical protein